MLLGRRVRLHVQLGHAVRLAHRAARAARRRHAALARAHRAPRAGPANHHLQGALATTHLSSSPSALTAFPNVLYTFCIHVPNIIYTIDSCL